MPCNARHASRCRQDSRCKFSTNLAPKESLLQCKIDTINYSGTGVNRSKALKGDNEWLLISSVT